MFGPVFVGVSYFDITMTQIAFVNLPLNFHFVGVYNSVGHARRVGFLMRQHFVN